MRTRKEVIHCQVSLLAREDKRMGLGCTGLVGGIRKLIFIGTSNYMCRYVNYSLILLDTSEPGQLQLSLGTSTLHSVAFIKLIIIFSHFT